MLLDRQDDHGSFLREKNAALAEVLPTSYHSIFPEDYAVAIEDDRGYVSYKYNVSTPYEAMASALYFKEHGGALPLQQQKLAAARINNALVDYGLATDAELEKTANLALGYTDSEGNPINDSADKFLREAFGLSVDSLTDELDLAGQRQTPRGKRKLAFQAKYANLNIPSLADYGGEDFGTDLPNSLILREALLEDKEKVASLRSSLIGRTPEACVTILEEFDYRHNLCQFYDLKDLPDPVASVYGRKTEKLALDFSTIVIGDTSYSDNEFVSRFSEHRDYFVSSLGESTVSQILANPAEVVNSLPDPIKDAIGYKIN